MTTGEMWGWIGGVGGGVFGLAGGLFGPYCSIKHTNDGLREMMKKRCSANVLTESSMMGMLLMSTGEP
jgi:hypothetical protein